MTYIYDIEVFYNMFLCIFKELKSAKWEIFEISPWQNDSDKLYKFLSNDLQLIGFNNLSYDNRMLLKFKEVYKSKKSNINFMLKRYSDNIIKSKSIDTEIKSLDLYRLWHFNNKARAMSLKAVQASIGFENILESSIDFDADVDENTRHDIITYCKNDVESTHMFYRMSREKIKLRADLSSKFKIDFTNIPDASIGEKILEYYLAESLEINPVFLREMRSKRSSIDLGSLILPYISFDLEPFKDVLEYFENAVVNVESKDKFKFKVQLDNTVYDFGLGGIHALNKKKVWKSTDTHIIMDLDVAGYYPNLCVANKWYPEHLTEKFVEVYKHVIEERKKYPKGTSMNTGLKLASNGTYGKFGDENSFLYDPIITYTITINGQLLLLMLNEWFIKEGIEIISSNTDGTSLYVPIDKQDKVKELVLQWEQMTGLQFETEYYDAMYYRDVNNYIWIKKGKKPKLKGLFEIDKEIHKDKSAPIIAKALVHYYNEGILPEETISNAAVSDFYMYQRVKANCILMSDEIKQQKVTRYIVTKSGRILFRQYSDKKVGVAVGHYVEICNDLSKITIKKEDIDIDFYLAKIQKWIKLIK